MGGFLRGRFCPINETVDLKIQPHFFKCYFHAQNEVPPKTAFYETFFLTIKYNFLFYYPYRFDAWYAS